MAKGYPDFYGYSIVPKYGAMTKETFPAQALASPTTTTIFEISGKGRSYQGFLKTLGLVKTFEAVSLIVTVDGIDLGNLAIHTEYEYSAYLDRNQLFTIVHYAVTDFGEMVVWSIARDYTWQNSVKVELNNISGNNQSVYGIFTWGRVV